MTTPRKHAELAQKYFSDSEMKCWQWNDNRKVWDFACRPTFDRNYAYYVGKNPPTELPKPMCSLVGIEFPMPVDNFKLQPKDRYFFLEMSIVNATAEEYTKSWDWLDKATLSQTIVHHTEDACIKNAEALFAANLQAIEKAKEKME